MRSFFRLVRYGVPYTFQWVAGVVLLAAVGALDTFRVLLLQPVFDQVLRPEAAEGPVTLGLPHSKCTSTCELSFRISCTFTTIMWWWQRRL